jgi:hypothetical protein
MANYLTSFPAIFASILIHIIQIRKGDACTKVLCEHRVRIAMHILEEFQDSWPLVVWTRHFLECLLNNGISGESSREGDRASTPLSTSHSESERPMTSHDTVASTVEPCTLSQADSASYSFSGEYQEPHAFSNGCHTPGMPLFAFNNVAEDMGINADAWLFDVSNNFLY